MKKLSALILIAVCISHTQILFASGKVLADPDHISTGIEYRGVPDARLGESFSLGYVSAGALFDVRNETRFNQGLLPNHNWRGFAFLHASYRPLDNKDTLMATAGFEHESAHPTMGFNDGNVKAYDKVYDSTYRTVNMNAGVLSMQSTLGSVYTCTVSADGRFYFKSRNTPELPVNDLSWSEGISCGAEFRIPAFNRTLFLSGFGRYIFESRNKVYGNIYYNDQNAVITLYKKYPVINSTYTLTARCGVLFDTIIPDRTLSVYAGILYGHIYGFVDSREKRTVFSAGIEMFH